MHANLREHVSALREATAQKAVEQNHVLRPWRNESEIWTTTCLWCGRPAAVYPDGSTSGLALSAPCPKPRSQPKQRLAPIQKAPPVVAASKVLPMPHEKCRCGRSQMHPGRCWARRGLPSPPETKDYLPLSPERAEGIMQSLRNGLSLRETARAQSVTRTTVQHYAKRLRRDGLLPKLCVCGLPMRHLRNCKGHAARNDQEETIDVLVQSLHDQLAKEEAQLTAELAAAREVMENALGVFQGLAERLRQVRAMRASTAAFMQPPAKEKDAADGRPVPAA